MVQKNIRLLVFVALAALVILSVVSAFATNNIVPATQLTDQTRIIDPNEIKPAACSGLVLNDLLVCDGGVCNGSNKSELILGTPGIDKIQGKKGDDCVVGGGGVDEITGDQDIDVCIGGPDNDILDSVECETQIQ